MRRMAEIGPDLFLCGGSGYLSERITNNGGAVVCWASYSKADGATNAIGFIDDGCIGSVECEGSLQKS